MSFPTPGAKTSQVIVIEKSAQSIPHKRNQPWTNWGKTAQCQPDFSFFPRNVEDLSQIVNFARETGRKIRAVGSGHSWSALVATDEILVYVQHLNQVRMDLSSPENPRVVVECGATVREVNAVLERFGYCLPFNVVLESVRFGGLIATGSHGSGWQHQTLSDLVHSIEIVSSGGELHKFEAGVDSEAVMNAARLNLGMFGLIYRMSLNIQKSWTVQAVDRVVSVEQTLANLSEWVVANDNLDLFWWPFCDQFWVKSWNRANQPITARPRYSLVDKTRSAIEMPIYQGVLESLKRFPTMTPRISPLTFKFTPSRREQVLDIVEAVHYRRFIEVTKMGCTEIAFKLDADFSNVKQAIQVAMELTKTYAVRGEYPFNVTMNVRFIHNSNCWLSPAFGEGHTCYIEILSRADKAKWEQFSAEVAQEWLGLPQARPHWAKEYRHIPGIIEHIKQAYGGNIARFNQIKAELGVDPEQMFINDALREIFL